MRKKKKGTPQSTTDWSPSVSPRLAPLQWAARARPSLSHASSVPARTPMHNEQSSWCTSSEGGQGGPPTASSHRNGTPQTYKLGLFKEKIHGLSCHLETGRTVDSELKHHSQQQSQHLCPQAPRGEGRGTYLCPGAFPGTPPPLRSRRRCSATFFLAAEESPTSEGLQTKRFWSLAEEKLAGSQCSWQTLGGLHFSICRRGQKCVCLHRLLAPPPRRPPPPAHRRYRRGWALQGVRLAVRSECKCYVMHYQM